MADQWYFSWDNKEFGPFTAAQLRDLAVLGRLQPADIVWKLGTDRRVRADRINHLFPDLEPTVVPAKSIPSELSSSLQASEDRPSLVPTSGAKLASWLPAIKQGIAGEELEDPIPDGLLLRALAGEATAAPPTPVPVPINPSSSQRETELKPASAPAVRKGRARAVSGAVITSQDGETARFIKKCNKCDYQASSSTVMPIRHGVSRVSFFCPKCKKMREATIEGIR